MMEIKDSEEWRDCVGYEGLYQVSNLGRVRSLYSKTRIIDRECKIMSQKIDSKGYFRVNLHKNKKQKGELVSRLVANAFIKNPKNLPIAGHWDDNKKNNKVENLYWTDKFENNHHNGKLEKWFKARGEKMDIIAKKLAKPVIGTNIKTGEETYFWSMQEAQRVLGISSGKISVCCNGKRKKANGYLWRFA